MKRMHIHISVNDLPESIRFYTATFGDTEPAVLKNDYRKWMLQGLPLNFAISQHGTPPGIDHVGIQVDSNEEPAGMNQRFAAADVPIEHQIGTTCCYSKSDKAWTVDPQGAARETSGRWNRRRCSASRAYRPARMQRLPAARRHHRRFHCSMPAMMNRLSRMWHTFRKGRAHS